MSTQRSPARAAFRDSIKQLWEHAGTTFGAAGVMCLPLVAVTAYSTMNPGWGTIALGSVAGGVVSAWVAYATVIATAEYLDGGDRGVGGLLRRSVSTGLVRFGATTLLVNLVTALIALLPLLPFLLALRSSSPAALLSGNLSEQDAVSLGIGLLVSLPLLVLVLIFLYLKLGLAPTASALEATNPVPSVRRSWDITKDHTGDFFVLTLMSLAVGLMVSLVVSAPAGIVGPTPEPSSDLSIDSLREFFGPGEPLDLPAALVTGASTWLSAALLTPFSAALLANFFLVLKKRAAGHPLLAPPGPQEPATETAEIGPSEGGVGPEL